MDWLTGIWSFLKLVWEIIAFWKKAEKAQEAAEDAKAEERRQDRDQAVDDLTGAQTEDEFDEAQDRIVRNKP